jgi:hypothetical protein
MNNIDEKYKRGKIYIVKCKYDDNLIYVGSTIRCLNRRFVGHRTDKRCSLYQFVNDDWDNFYIELYEECPCNNRKELEKREGEIIRLIGTINCKIAGRTMKEYREDNKEILAEKKKIYCEKNKEILAEKKKIYRENNKERLAEKAKEYNKNNREHKIQYLKSYRENNKEILAEKKKEKIKCDNCGFESSRYHITRHKRTIKCQEHKK